jgi:GR25 family glycosyltransferase involved in LPS biosynthesis
MVLNHVITWYIIILLITVLIFLFLKKTEGFDNKNYLNGIDIVYWINLDRSPERKKNMEKMFKDNVFNGIPNERISAVDGNNEDKVYDLFTVYNYNVGPKEYACTLSHLNTIKQFNESNYDVALILEDDCTLELKKYWKISIKEIMQNAPSDWEIIMLNYIILPGNDHPFLKWNNDYDSDYTEVLPSSCLSYIINKKGSNKIIKIENNKYILSDNIHHVADSYVYKSAKTYCYKYPMFIYPKDNNSNINDEHNSINEYARNLIIENYSK